MAEHASFIRQFRTGGDPCTFRESGELQAEISKLTHPARPDVDWVRVELLSLALFRQNGVELQTLVCYVLARSRQQDLAGMTEGLSALQALISQRWGDFWPVQVHSRIALLAWIAEKMQQALRVRELQYQDLVQINRCGLQLTEIETVLRRCEVWHLTKLDVLSTQLSNTARRLERLAPKGAEWVATKPVEEVRSQVKPENREEKSGKAVITEAPVSQKPGEAVLSEIPISQNPGQRRIWPVFIAGMLTMVCLGGSGLWGWSWLNQPEKSPQVTQMLPGPASSVPGQYGNERQRVETVRAQLKELNDMPPLWPLWQGEALLQALEAQWPDNPQIKMISAEWRKKREVSARPLPELQRYAQAQAQLQRLSQQLDALDERKGRYMTGSELKSAIFSIRQLLQTPPLEELLRQLDEQVQAGNVSPALQVQIDTHFKQLLNRYAVLLRSAEAKHAAVE